MLTQKSLALSELFKGNVGRLWHLDKANIALMTGSICGVWLMMDTSNEKVTAMSFHSFKPKSYKEDYLLRLEVDEDDRFRLIMLPGRPLGGSEQQAENIRWRQQCQEFVVTFLESIKI